MNRSDIVEKVKAAGVVGAGGAGFPTYIKLSSNAQIVIANGAECEPLIESDRHLMLRNPEKVVRGLRYAMEATGAHKGVMAIKAKHTDLRDKLTKIIGEYDDLELFLLDNFYPAGDEHILVYEVTGKVVPMGGIPLNVDVVVDNIYTLGAIADAVDGINFTHRYVTVTGEVKTPGVARLPIGMSIREAIYTIGTEITCDAHKIVIGGPMMGEIEDDLENPIIKTTNAILVLPQNCRTVELKNTSLKDAVRRSRSVCCQCNYCTDMCPRYLLGHDLTPHKTMRVFPNADSEINERYIYSASLCSECSLCGYYACTMGLAPNIVNAIFKSALESNKIKPDLGKMKLSTVNDFRDDRKVPVKRLINRMGLSKYDKHLPFNEIEIKPEKLILSLTQHIGEASIPIVRPGDKIIAGDMIAVIPENSIGSNIHSPFSGTVKEVSHRIIIECIK